MAPLPKCSLNSILDILIIWCGIENVLMYIVISSVVLCIIRYASTTSCFGLDG